MVQEETYLIVFFSFSFELYGYFHILYICRGCMPFRHFIGSSKFNVLKNNRRTNETCKDELSITKFAIYYYHSKTYQRHENVLYFYSTGCVWDATVLIFAVFISNTCVTVRVKSGKFGLSGQFGQRPFCNIF